MSELDRIRIRKLKLETILGVYAHEREKPCEIIADMVLYIHINKVYESDALSDTVDYDKVAQRARQIAKESNFHLLESLAHRITQVLLAEFAIARINLVLDKGPAVNYCQSVAFEVDRVREC
jgi:dihydroneopterin aldolase